LDTRAWVDPKQAPRIIVARTAGVADDEIAIRGHRNVDGMVEEHPLGAVIAADQGLHPGVEIDLPELARIGALDIARLIRQPNIVAGSRRDAGWNTEAPSPASCNWVLLGGFRIDPRDAVGDTGSVACGGNVARN